MNTGNITDATDSKVLTRTEAAREAGNNPPTVTDLLKLAHRRATSVRDGTDNTLQKQSGAREVLAWAFLHEPTREAYRRSMGEDIAIAMDRYRDWVEENLIGGVA